MRGCCFPGILDRSRSRRGTLRFIKSPCYDSSNSKHSVNRSRESPRGPLVVCFGEMMINLVPTVPRVSLADATAFKRIPAGATANVAVGISRLGCSTAFIGKVGNDEFGYMLSDILKQNGVDNSGLLFDANARTALAFYALKRDGQAEFMFYRNPSADMLLRPDEIGVSLIKKATIFHYGSVSLIQEPSRSAHLAAMSVAKVSGCILSYAPNMALPLWPSKGAARKGIMSIWNYADIIKVSVDEIRFLSEGDDPYDDNVIMKKLHPYNLKLLLVTEGARGCRYYTKEFKGWAAGFEVEAIDPTGAGDSFMGGLLSIVAAHNQIYKDEKRLREALDFANACGAFTVTGRGAIPSLPTKDAVLRIMFSYFNS
ncbi:probable fructokinase-7 isoform X2 [Cajanus cajan]|uniref:probable fructokinase-7 isoform X2 n=1 Tax=Cajanus cajan TaxID=3821 RepID=UPI0010FB3660|nr:probable fructokinase-7 isoform X2 [Cajanus cajan]